MSATFGWQNGWTVFDGVTASRWDLGDSQAYGGSIQRAVAGGVTLGVRANTAESRRALHGRERPHLVRVADTRVTQALGVVHVSSGRDLRSVFELGLGATIYSDFKERGTALRIGPDEEPTPTSPSYFVLRPGLLLLAQLPRRRRAGPRHLAA